MRVGSHLLEKADLDLIRDPDRRLSDKVMNALIDLWVKQLAIHNEFVGDTFIFSSLALSQKDNRNRQRIIKKILDNKVSYLPIHVPAEFLGDDHWVIAVIEVFKTDTANKRRLHVKLLDSFDGAKSIKYIQNVLNDAFKGMEDTTLEYQEVISYRQRSNDCGFFAIANLITQISKSGPLNFRAIEREFRLKAISDILEGKLVY